MHSVQFGPQGQVGSDWSSQEVRRRALPTSGPTQGEDVLQTLRAQWVGATLATSRLPPVLVHRHSHCCVFFELAVQGCLSNTEQACGD